MEFRFNISDLLTFLTVANLRSFSAAAQQLYVSQSTISARIRKLETELGVRLIDRYAGVKHIEVTAAGESFVAIAGEYLALNQRIAEWKAEPFLKKLRIASIDSLNSCLLRNFYPLADVTDNLSLEIRTHWTDQIYSLLENREADIGIVPRLMDAKTLRTDLLFEEDMLLVFNRHFSDYPERVAPVNLNKKDEVFFDWGAAYVDWHNQWFDQRTYPLAMTDITRLLHSSLAVPDAWCILPVTVLDAYRHEYPIGVSVLTPPPPRRKIYLVKPRALTEEKREAVAIFEEAIRRFLVTEASIVLPA